MTRYPEQAVWLYPVEVDSCDLAWSQGCKAQDHALGCKSRVYGDGTGGRHWRRPNLEWPSMSTNIIPSVPKHWQVVFCSNLQSYLQRFRVYCNQTGRPTDHGIWEGLSVAANQFLMPWCWFPSGRRGQSHRTTQYSNSSGCPRCPRPSSHKELDWRRARRHRNSWLMTIAPL